MEPRIDEGSVRRRRGTAPGVARGWHELAVDYDRTEPPRACDPDRTSPELAARYGGRFRCRWHDGLVTLAGAFRTRHLHPWQIAMSPAGFVGGYREIR